MADSTQAAKDTVEQGLLQINAENQKELERRAAEDTAIQKEAQKQRQIAFGQQAQGLETQYQMSAQSMPSQLAQANLASTGFADTALAQLAVGKQSAYTSAKNQEQKDITSIQQTISKIASELRSAQQQNKSQTDLAILQHREDVRKENEAKAEAQRARVAASSARNAAISQAKQQAQIENKINAGIGTKADYEMVYGPSITQQQVDSWNSAKKTETTLKSPENKQLMEKYANMNKSGNYSIESINYGGLGSNNGTYAGNRLATGITKQTLESAFASAGIANPGGLADGILNAASNQGLNGIFNAEWLVDNFKSAPKNSWGATSSTLKTHKITQAKAMSALGTLFGLTQAEQSYLTNGLPDKW